MHRHRARQQATCLSVKPRILVGSTKKATVHICSGHREGRGGIALNSLGVSVQYGAHSSSLRHIFFFFFFFCLSVGLPKFISVGAGEGGKPCVVCPRRLQGAHEAWVILWLHKTELRRLRRYTNAFSGVLEITGEAVIFVFIPQTPQTFPPMQKHLRTTHICTDAGTAD